MIYKKICKICGKEFECEINKRKYCSRECYSKVTAKNILEWRKNNPEKASKIYSQNLKKTRQKYPHVKDALINWKENNPELVKEISSETLKKTWILNNDKMTKISRCNAKKAWSHKNDI